MSEKKLISLLAILPFSLLIQALNQLYWGLEILPKDKTVFTSFFLAITIGPLILSFTELLSGGKYSEPYQRDSYKEIKIINESDKSSLNPFKILNKKEIKNCSLAAVLGVLTFFLSPVGMMVLISESFTAKIQNKEEKAFMQVAVMNALNNSSYVAGILIPLLALGVPLSPVSIGPGNALFNAPPVYTLDHNLSTILSPAEFVLPVVIGSGVALLLTYYLTAKYAKTMMLFISRHISHEAILGLFVGLVLLLAYMDAGIINVFGVLMLAVVSGLLNRLGVNYGTQFMILYASSSFVGLLH